MPAARATMGALFAKRLVRASLPDLAAWKGRHNVQCVGTAPRAGSDYRAAAYRAPLLLVMGWERQGMSDGQRAPCDLTVHLPMVGAVDSLNLAVATGVMLYQIHTRLRARDAPT